VRLPPHAIFTLPAVRSFLLFGSGIWLARCLTVPVPVWLCLALPVQILALGAFRRRPCAEAIRLALQGALHTSILLAGCIAGAAALQRVDAGLLPFCDDASPVALRGVVTERPVERPGRWTCLLESDSLLADGRAWCRRGRVAITRYAGDDDMPTVPPPRAGDTLVIAGRLCAPRPARNPGGFDYRSYLAQRGATTALRSGVRDFVARRERFGTPPVPALIDAAHNFLRRAIDALYTGDTRDIMAGLLLGDAGMIRDEVSDDFRDAGVIHILSVSGLHASIILVLVLVPLGRLPSAVRAILACAAIWFYAALTGMAAPVTRTAVMATVLLAGGTLQRLGRSPNTLGVAGLLILAADPLALFQTGFQLSFAAVAGILVFHPQCTAYVAGRFPRLDARAPLRGLVSLLALTACAQFGTLPILATVFGQISLVSLVANIVAVPLSFVALAGGVVSVLLWSVPGPCAGWTAATVDLSLRIILDSSRLFASLPGAVLDIGQPQLWLALTYVAVVFTFLRTPGRRVRRLLPAVLGALAVAAVLRAVQAPAPRTLRVTVLDVGQGDAVLVQTPGGSAMLVDAGPATAGFDAGERIVVPALRRLGVRRLDAFIITHLDGDHAGGAAAVLRAVDVRRVFISGDWSGRSEGDALLRATRARGKAGPTLRHVHAGDRIALDASVRVRVLGPAPGDSVRPAGNETSAVLQVLHGTVRMLLTGDAGLEAEDAMVCRYGDMLRADLLKVGHHGSRSGTGASFARCVHPAWAAISCGRNNRFRHPRPEVLARLHDMGARTPRTDIAGALMFESDGRELRRVRWLQ
jgi:competence protein ComEC